MILTTLIVIFHCIPKAATIEIIVYPNDTDCGGIGDNVQCHPISSLYIDNPDRLEISSNTTLFFLPGTYVLESSILFQDIEDLNLNLWHINPDIRRNDYSLFHCRNRVGLLFINVSNVFIYQIIMNNCGTNISQVLIQEDITLLIQSRFLKLKYENWVKAAIFASTVHNLTIYDSIINGSHGYGILGLNIFGNTFISESWFNSSNTISLTEHCMSSSLNYLETTGCQGGNALFIYSDQTNCPEISIEHHHLAVYMSAFTHGVDATSNTYSNTTKVGGFGLRLIQKHYDVDITIFNCTFYALVPGPNLDQGFSIKLADTVINSSILIYSSHFIDGSGLLIVTGIIAVDHELNNLSCTSEPSKPESFITPVRKQILHIFDSDFRYNKETSLSLAFHPKYRSTVKQVTHTVLIQYCRFYRNFGNIAHGIRIIDYGSNPTAEVLIEHTFFSANGNTTTLNLFSQLNLDLIATYITTNKIISARNVTFRNCIFQGNKATSIVAENSHIFFEGINHFANNSAFFGGAIYLSSSSIALLRPGATLFFNNNHALKRGGAVFIESNRNDVFFLECPIQVYDPTILLISQLQIHMIFTNNTASEAGEAIYGGQLDTCQMLAPSGFFVYHAALIGQIIFDYISYIEPQNTSSPISSDAVNICFCVNTTFDCSSRKIIAFHYPGETVHISMIGIGQRDGTVPAVVFGHLASCSNIEHAIASIETGRSCSMINCSLYSLNEVEYLRFEVEAQSVIPGSLLVEIVIQNCETFVGFVLDNASGVCTCIVELREINMTCDIGTRQITRQPPYWLGNYSNSLLLHDNCPYDYCKPFSVQIAMAEPNISEQCAFDRYGTLCGSCREGYSHVFGTSRCLRCSNTYLLLIIPFALTGIALVAFLYTFNLTVAVGTTNGLLFYANIVQINEAVFFPPGDASPFKVFISWLNLDLGIETCFYDGMDSYSKIWFQFVFPLYLWLILALIILLSRYSTMVVQLLGKHSVEVLATIFLLSFTKLVRTITTVMSFTILKYPNGDRALWLYDGNSEFGKSSHLALLFFSLLFLIVVALPYIFLLLLVQILRRYSDLYLFRWVSKMLPIFDAYLGPYRLKQGYWTGLLLFARVILVVTFAFNVHGNLAINIFVTILVATLLIVVNLAQGGVYKSKYLTALEISYILNLMYLAAATTLAKQREANQQYTVYISTTAALLVFGGILVYHAFVQIKYCIKRHKAIGQESTRTDS